MEDKLDSLRCARFLKALADADRLRIIQCLQMGPHNVSDLARLLGAGIANVSHHLGILRHAGIVRDEKKGKYVEYSLSSEMVRADEAGGVVELGCCRLELGRK